MDHKHIHPARLTLWLTVFALVVALVAGPAGLASAQGSDDPYCNGLSEADCALLQGAQSAHQTRTAFALPAFDFQMHVLAEGETLEAQMAGSGALMMAPAVLNLLALVPDMSQGMTDMIGMLDMLESIDEAMVESLLAESAGLIQLSEMTLSTPDETMGLQGDLVLRDSMLYLHLSAPNGADAWFGESLSLTSTDMADLRESLEEMRTQFESEEFAAAMAQMSEYQGRLTAIGDLVSKHVSSVRGDDATLHDQAMATFTTSFDLRGLLSDPELGTAVYELLSSPLFAELAGESADMSELNPAQVQLMMVALAMMFEDPTISTEQWIGLDDGLMHKTVSIVEMTIDTAVFGNSSSTPTTPIEIAMNFSVEMDDIETVDVAGFPVPEDYFAFSKTSGFLPGSPDSIDRTLELGQSFNGALTGDQTDIYAVNAAGGEKADIEIESEGYVTLALYGPDGFLMDKIEQYGGGALDAWFTAPGMYLVVVEGDSDVDYTLTLRVP